MIRYSIAFLLISLFGITTTANFNPNIKHLEQPKYNANEALPNLKIPINFGEATLLSDAEIKLLDVNEIYKIDLVYTQYKRNTDFDQVELNTERLSQLKSTINQINRDSPSWNFIAQTGPKNASTAESFFHGFVIYYRPTVNYNSIKKAFAPYRSSIREVYAVDNSIGGTFAYESGTRIHIPANAVVGKNGEVIKGNFDIHYTEYRNSADIALSGIPMKYKDKNENMNFSSVGMYEIEGFQNGSELELQQPVTVDFNATKVVDDASFYELNEANEWKLIHSIAREDFGAEFAVQNAGFQVAFLNDPFKRSKWVLTKRRGIQITISRSNSFQEDYKLMLNKRAWKKYQKIIKEGKVALPTERISSNNRYLFVNKANVLSVIQKIYNKKFTPNQKGPDKRKNWRQTFFLEDFKISSGIDDGNRTTSTLLAEGMGKGHTYPSMVKGLKSETFRVYNCDQIYRLGPTKTIHPGFTIAEKNQAMPSPDIACLIDLNYNGSFSFDPNFITYSEGGKNALLVTTENGST